MRVGARTTLFVVAIPTPMPFHVVKVNENAVIFSPECLFNIWCKDDTRPPRRRDLATPHPPRYSKAQALLATSLGVEVMCLGPIPPEVRHVDHYANFGSPVSAGEGLEETTLVDVGPGLSAMVDPDGKLCEMQ